MVSGSCQQLLVASLTMQLGCRTWAAAKRLIYRGCGVSWVVGTEIAGVLWGLVVCAVGFLLQPVVQSGPG